MIFRIRSPQDFGAGILFMLVGLAGVYFGKDLTYGNAMRMGPGFFPMWLSWIIIGMGAFIGLRGLAIDGPSVEMPQWRPLIGVVASILVFGMLIETLGTPITIIILTFVAAFSRPSPDLKETAILAVCLAVFAVIAFIYGLGQPLPLWWDF